MKKMKFLSVLLTLLFVVGCEQEILVQTEPVITGEPGSADFTKFVSIGNSLTAGYMSSALFRFGQENSYPAIMAEHFAFVSENDPFDQPLVNSVNGCFNPSAGCTLGRLILFDPDGPTGPLTASPTPAGSPGVPAPFNTNATDHLQALAPYTGNKDNLNNFGVPGIILAQALTPATGGPPPPAPNPAYNPYFARFAKTPSTDGVTGSTILSDALATNPTFVSFWLGNNDVLGYAVGGASNPSILTSVPAFTAQYSAAIDAILAHPNNVKMVVGNIPNVTTIPFFRLVPYNAVVITNQAQIDAINAGYAPYNAGLDAAFGGGFITAEERDKRKVIFTLGQNPVVIVDESLTNLGGMGLPSYREATAQDLLVLPAASFIGTLVSGDPTLINGVTVPLADQWVLIPSEITEITTRINDFNAAIAAKVAANSSRMALADIFTKFNEIATSPTGGIVVDGFFAKATLAPPNGIFSEDGVHPNAKGSAYIAKIFIQAINARFGSTVPEPNVANFYGTGLPVSPPL